MKKLICLFLVVLLLFPAALAGAEAEVQPGIYTHPVLGYSLTPAEGWLLLDDAIVNDVLKNVTDGKSVIQDEQARHFASQLTGTLVTAALSPDRQVNLVIGPENLRIDADIKTVAPAILPSLLAALSALEQYTIDDGGSFVRPGETDFLRICASYKTQGLTMRVLQYVACQDGIGYYLTFTSAGQPEPLSMEALESEALPFVESFVLPAPAEKTTTPYTHADWGFSMNIPEGWMAIDRQNIDAILAEVDKGTFTFAHPMQITQMAENLRQYNFAFALMEGGAANLNIITEPCGPDEDINDLAPLYKRAARQHFSSYDDVDMLDEGSVVRFGETDFFRVSSRLTAGGTPLHISQYIACSNGTAYCITLNCSTSTFTAEIMDAIARPFLESFQMPAAN